MFKKIITVLIICALQLVVVPNIHAQSLSNIVTVIRNYLGTPTSATNLNSDTVVNSLDIAQSFKNLAGPTATIAPAPTSPPNGNSKPTYPPPGTSWSLKFEDNFNGTDYDRNKWNLCHGYEDGVTECIPDWYAVNYMTTTPDSVTVGPTTDPVTGQTLNVVKLWALNEKVRIGSKDYFKAGALTTSRPNGKYEFRTGYMEVKARLPVETGLDPAIWTMSTGHQGWPQGGEMDLIEQKGKQLTYDVAVICGESDATARWDLKGVYAADKAPLQKPVDGAFHIYSMYWTNTDVKIYLDGNLVGWSGSDNKCPSNKVSGFDPHFILLTMLMGTSGSGYPTNLSGRVIGVMEVDYVRVWQ